MRYTITSTVAFAAAVVAQGVTEQKKPDSSAPSGCSPSYDGEFEISVANVTSSNSKRSFEKRQQAEADKLLIKLQDGVLTDSENRTGYIAANHQFQFDGPAQTGAIYTAGWSACGNGSLALGGEAVFYQCLTGNPTGPGSFYNLYDESDGDQCNQVTINISGASSSSSSSGTEQIDDGQPQAATSATPTASVGQIDDGQPQAATSAATSSAASVGQIDDGQVQAATSATGAPVSQIDDGQIQAPTGTPASQIPDGQVQAPYPANNATAPAPSGTGSPQTPAPFEGAATQAYTAGAAAVVALLGFVAAL